MTEKAARAQAIDALNRANAGLRWDAQRANQAARQQAYENRMGLLGAQANARLGVGSGYAQAAQRAADMGGKYGALFTGAGMALDKMYGDYGSEKPNEYGYTSKDYSENEMEKDY